MASVIWHPFTSIAAAEVPISIVGAKGSLLFTEDGKSLIDGIASWWVNLHGHCHPHIVEAIQQQATLLDHVLFAGCTHAGATTLAERLLGHFMPSGRVFYSDNGSTAVEVALKMAIQYWHNRGIPKTKILYLKGGYHGDTFGAMSVSDRTEWNRPFWPHLFESVAIDPFDPDLSSLEEVAAFIFEPYLLGAGGMKIYPRHNLEAIVRRCRSKGVLCIADEVLTGFGRLGPISASFALNPDLICLAKGITGGTLTLGATLATQKIYEVFRDHTLFHGHSYTANPIACAAGLASMDLLERPECAQQRERIALLHQVFVDEHTGDKRLVRCESIGTILVLELRTMPANMKRFFADRGVLLRPLGNVLYVLPPYCIKDEELEKIYFVIDEFLSIL